MTVVGGSIALLLLAFVAFVVIADLTSDGPPKLPEDALERITKAIAAHERLQAALSEQNGAQVIPLRRSAPYDWDADNAEWEDEHRYDHDEVD